MEEEAPGKFPYGEVGEEEEIGVSVLINVCLDHPSGTTEYLCDGFDGKRLVAWPKRILNLFLAWLDTARSSFPSVLKSPT